MDVIQVKLLQLPVKVRILLSTLYLVINAVVFLQHILQRLVTVQQEM